MRASMAMLNFGSGARSIPAWALSRQPAFRCSRHNLNLAVGHAHTDDQRQATPLCVSDHRSRGLAVCMFQSEPEAGGGAISGMRRRRILRKHPALDPQVLAPSGLTASILAKALGGHLCILHAVQRCNRPNAIEAMEVRIFDAQNQAIEVSLHYFGISSRRSGLNLCGMGSILKGNLPPYDQHRMIPVKWPESCRNF